MASTIKFESIDDKEFYKKYIHRRSKYQEYWNDILMSFIKSMPNEFMSQKDSEDQAHQDDLGSSLGSQLYDSSLLLD
jgi:hypothetical protein